MAVGQIETDAFAGLQAVLKFQFYLLEDGFDSFGKISGEFLLGNKRLQKLARCRIAIFWLALFVKFFKM
ncbi:MAG: hypothetical protein JWQ71_166 [Pedosphaera sp.]|nr:hypothetical protein [Pedosphaera sp.]